MSALFEVVVLKKLKKLGKKLNRIQTRLDEMENNMSAELDRLTVEVQEMGTVVDSAIALLQGLATQLEAIKNDPAAISALADELDVKANALADAITANTPA